MPYVVVQDGGAKKVYPLAKDVVNVGRSSKSDVRIDNASISRMHCRFIRGEEGFKVKDLGSRNGTLVNRLKVDEHVLQDGDEVSIGEVNITFLMQKPPVETSGELTQPLSIYDEKTSLLLQTILASIQIREMDRFLPVVVDNVVKLTGAERGILLFKSPPGAPEPFEVRLARDTLGVTIEDVADFSQKIPQKVIESGQPIFIRDLRDETAKALLSSAMKYNLVSIMCVPLRIGSKVFGALYVDSHTEVKEFAKEDHLLLQAVANHIALAIENVRLYEQQMLDEMGRREELERENIALKNQLEKHQQLVGECPAMKQGYEIIRKAAPTDATVLIEGESGTGKEAVAHLLHDLSPRSGKNFVVVDCAAIPETLLESELFGYEKGAFTGAASQKIGKFEHAHGGTIFLDEIGELSPALQAKLLRSIQEKQVTRVGGVEPVNVDVRVLAATNRNLSEMIKEGKFRQDLFYRLNVVTLKMPPLRERGSDIALLAEHFLARANEQYDKAVQGFDVEARDGLLKYNWPGNVRELKHRIERAVILTNHERLSAEDLDLNMTAPVRPLDQARDRFEKQYIFNALVANKHNVTRTASSLGISRQHLQNLIKKHNL
jgi:transcriptional regulator with GAF, ATPase, and Fis domain